MNEDAKPTIEMPTDEELLQDCEDILTKLQSRTRLPSEEEQVRHVLWCLRWRKRS
jgi:hypothetical protein